MRPQVAEDPFEDGFGFGLFNQDDFQPPFTTMPVYNAARIYRYIEYQVTVLNMAQCDAATNTTMFNALLSLEFFCRMLAAGNTQATCPKFRINQERAEIGAMTRKAAENLSAAAQKQCMNPLAMTNDTISPTEFHELFDILLSRPDASSLDLSKPFTVIQFCAQFCTQAQICRRGEDLYKSMLHHRFVKYIEGIGEDDKGTLCSWLLMKGGKVNKVNRSEWTAHAPHADPIRDATGWHGNLWMYRYCVKLEPMPPFHNWEELKVITTYRQYGKDEPQDGPTFAAPWKHAYGRAGFITTKVTHQWKGQGAREMKNAGIVAETLALFEGNRSTTVNFTQAILNSYCYDPAIECLLQRAGADDIEKGRDHNPAYNQVDVPDELLLLLPGMKGVLEIRDELKRLDKEIRDKKQRLEESLDTRLLNVLAFIHDISRALQVSAARPVNPDTFELLENEPTMREKYRYGLMSGVYDLEVFDSSEYREFGAKIRAAEDAAAASRERLKGKTPAEADILDQLKEMRNEMRQLVAP